MKIQRFEELICLQKARELSVYVYYLSRKEKFKRDYSHSDQINSSAGSGMDNIAEGFERGGNKEFLQFLYIAKGSFGETRSQLYRAYDRQYISEEEFNTALDLAEKASSETQKFISSIHQKGFKGYKYNY